MQVLCMTLASLGVAWLPILWGVLTESTRPGRLPVRAITGAARYARRVLGVYVRRDGEPS